MFSFWQDPTIGSGISQARFDVVVGRTCYEVVQAQSFILPGRIPVVDTTIFARRRRLCRAPQHRVAAARRWFIRLSRRHKA
jgi:hypothetical protein